MNKHFQPHPSVHNHILCSGYTETLGALTRSVPNPSPHRISMLNHSGAILRYARIPGGQVEPQDAPDRLRLGNGVRVRNVR